MFERFRLAARTALTVCLAAVAAGSVSTAGAHHALLVEYDVERTLTLEGTVTRLTLGHPHVRLYLAVDGSGERQEWMVEGGSHTTLRRAGWAGTEIQPGDRLRVVGYPGRSLPYIIHWVRLTTGDGQEVWGERPGR